MARKTGLPSVTLRIAYVGNYQPDLPKDLNEGIPWSTESHVALSFEALGHEVIRIQENGSDPFRLALDAEPDLFLWTRTWPVDTTRALRTLLEFHQRGIPTAAFHLDIFRGLRRSGKDEYAHPMFQCDHVFTADGEEPEQWTSRGINHHWLRPGVLAAECVPGTPQPQFAEYDVCFVGSRQYHPEWPHRWQLIDFLRKTYGKRFLHVGGDGEYPGTGHALRGQALNDLYASIPVFVGDSCFAHPRAKYWSDRAYEAPGRGAFQLFPYIEALAKEIVAGRVCQLYYELENWDDLKEEIDIWVSEFRSDVTSRPQWVATSSAYIRDNCSYTQRCEELLRTIGLA